MSKIKIPRETRDRWLVVEGTDDQYVTIELLTRHGAFWGDEGREASDDLPHIRNANGFSALKDIVAVQAKSKQRLGVIFDADLGGGKAWTEVRKRLLSIDSPSPWLSSILAALPETIPPGGLVLEHDERALGVWVMPDNGIRGALEDFLVDLVPPGDVHWPHARSSVAAAVDRGASFKHQYRSKAEIHTWLAWQDDPGVPFGMAVKRKFFLHDSTVALAFVAWFRQMFPSKAASP